MRLTIAEIRLVNSFYVQAQTIKLGEINLLLFSKIKNFATESKIAIHNFIATYGYNIILL